MMKLNKVGKYAFVKALQEFSNNFVLLFYGKIRKEKPMLEKLKLLFKELLGKDLTDEQAKKLEETFVRDEGQGTDDATKSLSSSLQNPTPNTQFPIPGNNEEMKLILKLLEEQKAQIASERAAREELIKKIEEDKKQQIKQKADAAIAEAIKNKKIAAQDDAEKKKWEKRLSENYDDAMELLGKLPALQTDNTTITTPTANGTNNSTGSNVASRAELMKNATNVFKSNKD